MDSSKISACFFICMLFISLATPILGCGSCSTGKPKHKSKPGKGAPISVPPVLGKPGLPLPPVPPVTVPPVLGKPGLPLPPVPPVLGKPGLPVPPVTVPPVLGKPGLPLPPVPPVTVPPVLGKPGLPLPPVPPVLGKPGLPLPPVPPVLGKPGLPLPPLPPVPPVLGKPGLPLPPVLPGPPSTKPGAGCPPPPAASHKCPINTLKLGACVDLLGGLVHVGLGDPVVNKCCPVLQGLVEVEAAACLCTTLKIKLLNLKIFVPLALELLVTCGKTPPPGFTCSL